MTATQKFALTLGLVLLVGFGAYQAVIVVHERRERSHLNAQPATALSHRPPPSVVTPPLAPVPAPRLAKPPAADSSDPAAVLDQRVALFKQLLNELPAQRLPELRLNDTEDWLAIARAHNLESTADIRLALADLRAVARKKIATSLQEALRQYTSASGGQLPADTAQLAPYLAAPADAEMLAHYEVTRGGQLGDPSEKLIREKKTSDMVLSVGLDGWSVTNNPDLPPAFGETENDALDRTWRALSNTLDDEAKADMQAMTPPTAMVTLMQDAIKQTTQVYGDDDAMGAALKQAVKDFQTANPRENLSDLAQVLPYLSQAGKFAEVLRPTLAQLAYFADHDGQMPPDPSALQPYLSRPFNAAEAMKVLKLSTDGEHVTMSFNWEIKK